MMPDALSSIQKGKKKTSLKKKESLNLSHQINEFAELTLSSF